MNRTQIATVAATIGLFFSILSYVVVSELREQVDDLRSERDAARSDLKACGVMRSNGIRQNTWQTDQLKSLESRLGACIKLQDYCCYLEKKRLEREP